jgi:hypothetical protein
MSIGVTGHRDGNAAFSANRDHTAATLEAVLDRIGQAIDHTQTPIVQEPTRLLCLLADGADQLAAGFAQARGWRVAAPLPFGRELNLAINSHPHSAADVRAILDGKEPAEPDARLRASKIAALYQTSELFELADQDAAIGQRFLASLDAPDDTALQQSSTASISERVALAGRVMIEQSDLLIAVWDGVHRNLPGGTGHTIAAALDLGLAVVRIDPNCPDHWHIMQAPEQLSSPPQVEGRDALLERLVNAALRPGEGGSLSAGAKALASEAWHSRSATLAHGYRRIEAMFDGGGRPFRKLAQTYETPDQIANGSAAGLMQAAEDLPGGDRTMVARIEAEVLRRFAWADGISSRLSDAYRGGMIANFLLSAMSIVFGIAYQPFASLGSKWIFAGGEFLLLVGILFITALGGRWRWHKRWFETRRVAEYFRHAPILLLMGVARPVGRWPRGADTSWPEYYARHGLRALGLPKVRITQDYLRSALAGLLDPHVVSQRDYHFGKAKRLTTVHHKLDKFSETLFLCAVLSVSTYLAMALTAHLGLFPRSTLDAAAKTFTFLGVMFPTFGASIAGIRYFGDFERFAAISQVTAHKLDSVHDRIALLLAAPEGAIDFGQVAALAHATDETVVSEIENWQAVFGGKGITVPV